MYLKSIQIVNFRNFKNAHFDFDKGTNTIIGENDSGKSNALAAIRILLDSNFLYTGKNLKESDFCHDLDDWRGHWIIISATFDGLTDEDTDNESCDEIRIGLEDCEKIDEGCAWTKQLIQSNGTSCGTVTLYIRPSANIQKKLHEAQSPEEFNKTRDSIQLADYDFDYRARSMMDFTKDGQYTKIVGNIDEGKYEYQEDTKALGVSIHILDFWKCISVCYIGALRDVKEELYRRSNPLKKIFDVSADNLSKEEIRGVEKKAADLNKALTSISFVKSMEQGINDRLHNIVGLVYSPDVSVSSRLQENIDIISRYLSLLPTDEKDMDYLGLGHLNVIYMALKMVEFDARRNHEVLNIMLIEEPEAHIHTHIQKSLFSHLKSAHEYTQVLMTTHSTHISEVSHIHSMNILKKSGKYSIVMHPDNHLDCFGNSHLNLKNGLSLTVCLERYLDAKRSTLLFSKGVILVEGDAEEILIPAMVEKAMGVSLDELGIGLVNVGSVAFEYIASMFSTERVQKYCAILTDSDVQIPGTKSGKGQAEGLGRSRKEKLEALFGQNAWVDYFFAPHTFEVDFAGEQENRKFISALIDEYYKREDSAQVHKEEINGTEAQRYDAVMGMAKQLGKGWMATLLAGKIDSSVTIPDYILNALAFASQEVVTENIRNKIKDYESKIGLRYPVSQNSKGSNVSRFLKFQDRLLKEKN